MDGSIIEVGLIEITILILLGVVVGCFYAHYKATSELIKAIDVESSQVYLVTRLEKSLREANEDLRKGLLDLDQGLRSAVSSGIKDGLVTAFEQVQAGLRAQSDELGKFGSSLKDDVGTVKTEVTALAEKVAAALTGMNEKLSMAELAAADGRSMLLRDTAAAIVRASEAALASQAEFRNQLTERLDALASASGGLMKQATDTFSDIKGAIVASEEKTAAALASQHLTVQERLTKGQLDVSDKLTKDLSELMRMSKEGFDLFFGKLREEQEQLRGLVGTKLEEMRAGNEAKLEDMRKAVDEKLQSALEKQIGESFQRIADQFAAVQQAIGQVQHVAGQVGDLRRLFSNVKSRGGWGEAQAEAMLQDMLPSGAYEKNMKVREGTGEFVEFAVRIPGKNGENKWLPIDSKFPTEDYERLLTANEIGNREDEAAARLALERRIRLEAERIGSKYICAPKTVDFAVLYLPSDSLFAEVARSPGLVERIRRDHKIMVMGPSLLPAFLHTINIGYMTVALERNVTEIGETLSAVKAEWGKLIPWLDKIADRTDSLKRGIEAVQQRARAVGRTLRSVDVIDHARADAVLGLDSPTFIQDAVDEEVELSDEIALGNL